MNTQSGFAVPSSTASHSGLRSGWFIGVGVVLIILGALACYYASGVTLASTMFFGILMAIGGVVQIVHSFAHSSQRTSQRILSVLLGLCGLAAGILICDEPAVGSQIITIFLSAVLIVGGIFRIIWAVNYRSVPGWWMGLLNGILTLLIGILLYVYLPWSGLFFLGTLIGIELIFSGITALAFALGLRGVKKTISQY